MRRNIAAVLCIREMVTVQLPQIRLVTSIVDAV
jgi:hypothetical protein